MNLKDGFGRPYPAEDVYGCVGPGWRGILERLLPRLLELGWDGSVHQCKEKFGGLRLYIGSAPREVHDAIDVAERESLHTCEDCGAPGKPQHHGWIRTLCPPCAEIDRARYGPPY
jgi:hypothetical protein